MKLMDDDCPLCRAMGPVPEDWELYKGQTERIEHDVDFYRDFCSDRPSLELYAGFGRVANRLAAAGVDLDVVEPWPELARFIQLPPSRKHLVDPGAFRPERRYERVFAALNALGDFEDEAELHRFLVNLGSCLTEDGSGCLSYLPAKAWRHATPTEFEVEGRKVTHMPGWDLSTRARGRGLWFDHYIVGDHEGLVYSRDLILHDDPVRLQHRLSAAGLRLEAVVRDQNRALAREKGWIDFIVKRT